MMAMVAEDLPQIPMSPFLAASLERAAQYATAQAHREVLLEHVLLALAEDPEASVILRSSDVDIARLQSDVSNFLGNLSDHQQPEDARPVGTSHELQRILEAAAEAAKQGQRREINGAILLAAIIGDGSSTAAHILRSQGLTFEATIAALRNTVQQPQSEQTATPPDVQGYPPDAGQTELRVDDVSTNDALAAARQRVNDSRGATSEPAQPTSLEPQWVPASPPQTPPDQGGGESPPDERRDGYGDQAAAASPPPQWTPPQPTERSDPPPAPRLQRVPPPLPPDAGLRPPQRREPVPESPPQPSPPPPPMPERGPPAASGGVAAGPAHVPPWVGDAGSARGHAPQQTPGGQPRSGAAPKPRSTQIRVDAGQLIENIPRKMKTGVSELVEVRIARANVKALAQGLQGGGAVHKHEAMITKAMSVKLRAPDGGFWVEAASPETQWIDNVLGVMTDDFASWRWSITPKASGRKKLQLVVSARTVGSDGLAAETALPDQIFDIRVAVNYRQASKRAAGWLAAAVFGGVLARFGEGTFDLAKDLMSKIGGV